MIAYLLTLPMSCVLAFSPPTRDLDNYIHCRKVEKQVEVVAHWQPLIAEHFKPQDHIKALQIIYCESRGKPTAVGVNKDGTKDIGLWQFNDNTWDWLKNKLNITSPRTNPKIATVVASWLVYNDGWHHWNSSKHCWDF